MFNTLRMQFGGIVCFALSAGQAGIEKVQALLADAREPGNGPHAGHHPPHVAALQFYTDQLSPNNRLDPDLRFRRPGNSREQGVVFLVLEDLELEEPGLTQPPVVAHGRANDYTPANDFEERDFFWVADVARLGVTGLKAGCVDTAVPAPDGLLARFNLRGGVLYTGEVERSGGAPLRATFINPNSNPVEPLKTYSQSLALWSEWEVPVGSADVTIRLTSFTTGEQRQLVLSCAGLPFGESLWASVKNVTMPDLFEVSDVIEPGRLPGIRGGHFDLHYSLADSMPMPVWIPDPATVTDGKPLCPPAQFRVGL
jgi:hypothetical protein